MVLSVTECETIARRGVMSGPPAVASLGQLSSAIRIRISLVRDNRVRGEWLGIAEYGGQWVYSAKSGHLR
jgi:hypothetical protein